MAIFILVPNSIVYKSDFHGEKEESTETQLSHSSETSNDFIIVNGTNMSVIENETWKQQTNGHYNDFDRTFDSASQNQVIGNNFDDKS